MVEKLSEFRRQMEDGTVLVFVPKKAESAVKDSEGQTISMTYATKAEFQPVKIAADNAVRKDISERQTIAGVLIVGGHDLTKAMTTHEPQEITGAKTFVVARTKNSLETKVDVPTQQRQTQPVQVIDRNDEQVMFNQLLTNTNGTRQYRTNLFSTNGTRVTVENIFINADGTGYSTCVNPSANAPSSAIVNKAYVENTDGVTNNLVHRSADESIKGIKVFENGIDGQDFYHPCHVDNSSDNIWKNIISFDYKDNRACIFDIISVFNNNDVQNAKIKIRMLGATVSLTVIESEGTTSAMASASNYVVTLTGTRVTVKAYKRRRYTDLAAKLVVWHNYQTVEVPPEITYPNTPCADPNTETFDSMQVGTLVPYRNVA